MAGFKMLEGDYAIISSGGVYKQVPLAERNGLLYAAVSGGFVKMSVNGGTSNAKLRLVELSYEDPLHMTPTGSLCTQSVADSKPLETPVKQRLLSAPE